jgi:hypothetical protein
MRVRQVRDLLLLNGALLGMLALVTFAPSLSAQTRPRGDYTMAAGNVKNAQAAVLYIVDEINQELVSLAWDINARQLVGVAFRDLGADAGTLRNSRN